MMDTTTISLAVGLIVSLAFTELFGLAAGGMIVPGYFALCMHRPGCIALTLLAALAVLALVRFISQGVLVYGRRRIALMLILGFLLGAGLRAMASIHGPPIGAESSQPVFSVIGFIIPGLIALWMDRQGFVETLTPVLTLSAVVRLSLIMLGMEVVS